MRRNVDIIPQAGASRGWAAGPRRATLLLGVLLAMPLGACQHAGPSRHRHRMMAHTRPGADACARSGGRLVVRTSPGQQTGLCRLPDGSTTEEWAYFPGSGSMR
ncbi:DUF333 domain-containing protein [Nguyenibacter vanlangensis]|uniref:DUF333 domain-containing protein n=1 Tax=Nguyenibacter vanlangensis TaxID=1216886 RepID=A0A7Y7IW82_9PROT|nr:DUF333 domain-containing protein [Nguyenibacter vanlangensis]NVN10951.1 DUF333 domain-containing protein [Nguyenibacter vanlangensis]